MLRNTLSSPSSMSQAATPSNPPPTPSSPAFLLLVPTLLLLLPPPPPSGSVSAAHLDLVCRPPPPSTAARTLPRLLLDSPSSRVGDLHGESQPVLVGAAHDHEAPATPCLVLWGAFEELGQKFYSRTRFRSDIDIWNQFAGGVAVVVDDGFISAPPQQQVRPSLFRVLGFAPSCSRACMASNEPLPAKKSAVSPSSSLPSMSAPAR